VLIATILCVFGACCSTIFCSNWGFTYFDVVDHYLNVYLVLLMGILQSVAVAWFHCIEDAMKISKASTLVLVISYFGVLTILPWLAYFVFPNESWISIPAFWGFMLIMILVSFLIAKLGPAKACFKTWYDEILFSGVRPIAYHCMRVAESPMSPFMRGFFNLWWCVSIKYVFPWAMYVLVIMTIKKDAYEPYGEYHYGWQILGAIMPLAGLIVFFIPICFAKGPSDGSFKAEFAIPAEEPAADAKVEPKTE